MSITLKKHVSNNERIFITEELEWIAKISSNVNLYNKAEVYEFINQQIQHFEENMDLSGDYELYDELSKNLEDNLNLVIRFTSIHFGDSWFGKIPSDSFITNIINEYKETDDWNLYKDVVKPYHNNRRLFELARTYFDIKRKESRSNHSKDKDYSKHRGYATAIESYIEAYNLKNVD